MLLAAGLVVVPAVGGAETLTLRQAIAEALAASPALRAPDDGRMLAAIRARQEAARFGIALTPSVQTSEAEAFAQRSVGLGVTKRTPFGTVLQFNADTYQFGDGASRLRDVGYTFGVSQPLLRGWTATASAPLEQARRSVASAARAYTDARQRLVVSVAEAYFTVLRARRLADAADRAHDRAVRLRISSQARAKVGLATELDVLRADLLASQSEAQVLTQREALESATDSLSTLIGRRSSADAVDDDLSGLAATPAEEPVDSLIATGLGRRIDIQEAHDRIGDAKLAESVARWNLLPPVNLDVSYSKRGIWTGLGASAFDPFRNGWRVGLSTSYAIDRHDETAAAAAAAVTTRAAAQDAADIARRAMDDVRRAHRAWTRTAATIALAGKAVDIAERQQRLAQIRYERGVADNFDVIDAENNLFQAQTGLVAAQIERALAALTLQRATGTLDPQNFAK